MPNHEQHDVTESHVLEKFFSERSYQMVNVGEKKPTHRRAIAQGEIFVGKDAFLLIKERKLPKGDALSIAEIAGITGAKKASESIPLCHPLPLDQVSVHTELDSMNFSITVYCLVSAFAKTGVEMEALAGANAALLTIYDLTKMIEPALTISNVRLIIKEGGKKGQWIHPEGVPASLEAYLVQPQRQQKKALEGVSAAVLTISDRASIGEYDDQSGKILTSYLEKLGCDIQHYQIIPDETEEIIQSIRHLTMDENSAPQLIITTGGTGLSPRDVTPEAIAACCDKEIPGFGELLRREGSNYTKYAWLSRSFSGILGKTLIITLPGNPNAVKQGVDALKDILPHALGTCMA